MVNETTMGKKGKKYRKVGLGKYGIYIWLLDSVSKCRLGNR